MANPYRLRRRVDEALQRAGIVPGGLIETNATTNALMAVRAGLGVAIVEPVTAFGVGIKGLAIRPLDTAIPFLWGVMTPTARPLSALIEAFIGALESVAVECLPGFRRRDPGERSLTEAVYGRSATARHRIPRQPRKKA
jgi:DNA-binding transcriptional LysR family regulator